MDEARNDDTGPARTPGTAIAAHTLRLVLGDQLNARHSWFSQADPGVVYVLMEVRSETDYVLHHAQKVLAIFAAMREFGRELRAAGHRVRYVRLDNPSNRQSVTGNLEALAAHYQAQRVQWQHPDEWRLDSCLKDWAAGQPVDCVAVDTEHFLTGRGDLAAMMGERKPWLMEDFYRHMRRRWQLLITAHGRPEGGRWNYDHDNRKRWPGAPPEPHDWRPTHDHRALWAMVQQAGVKSFGNPQADAVRRPLNRKEALHCLDAFIDTALPHFGAYEDALASNAPRLFHSLLSFAMNVKMLHPLEVVQRAEAAYRAGKAPLAAVEGFVRQILGWRLMVIGNFALLAGLDPKALHHWYLGIYIDAFEWVELPNTLGMSQRADGGVIATKPYVSSAAYLKRMSDYCRGCAYDPQQKTGPAACPFNALYWDFFARHAGAFQDNPRVNMVYRQLTRMPEDQREAIQQHAAQVRRDVERL